MADSTTPKLKATDKALLAAPLPASLSLHHFNPPLPLVVALSGGADSTALLHLLTGLPGARGQFDADTLKAAVRAKTRYAPPQTLVEVEQTSNLGGGSIWPQEKQRRSDAGGDDRQVDQEDPVPAEIVADEAADVGAGRRAQHHRHR